MEDAIRENTVVPASTSRAFAYNFALAKFWTRDGFWQDGKLYNLRGERIFP